MGIPVDEFLKHLSGAGVTSADVLDQFQARPAATPAAPTAADLTSLLAGPGHGLGPAAEVFATLPDPYAGMNKTERRYVREVLEPAFRASSVLWWRFEAVKLRLAPRCFLTIDFAVVDGETRLELIDVKGKKGDSWWAEEDARIKLRLAAHTFPVPISVAWPLGKGRWGKERIGVEGR